MEARSRSNELDWLASFADGILYGYTSMTKPFEVPIGQLSDLWAYVDKACAWVDEGQSQSRVRSFSLIDGNLGYTRGERSFWLNPPDTGCGLWKQTDDGWIQVDDLRIKDERDGTPRLDDKLPGTEALELVRTLFHAVRAAYLRLPGGRGWSVVKQEKDHVKLGRRISRG